MRMVFFRKKMCILCIVALSGITFLLFGISSRLIKSDIGLASYVQGWLPGNLDKGKHNVILLLPKADKSRVNSAPNIPHSPANKLPEIKNQIAPPVGDHKVNLPIMNFYPDDKSSIEKPYSDAIWPNGNSTRDRVHVLIVTNRRSGSTFLGEMFNQNPHVFYQYETLRLPEKESSTAAFPQFLQHVLKCELDRTLDLAKYWNREHTLRSYNKAMLEPPLCSIPKVAPLGRKPKCQPMTLPSLMSVCRKKQHQVNKLIRLATLSSLESLANDPEINLKIIHLVRDPRAIYLSRAKIASAHLPMEPGTVMDNALKYMCRRISENLNFVASQPAWIQERYKLVRYEDMARRPSELARDIYDFTGIGSIPDEVQEWIKSNTDATVDKRDKGYVYSTRRMSALVAEQWRYNTSIAVVRHMQKFCRSLMKRLGYLEVETQEELMNKNKSLVLSFPTLMTK